jgi:hypothetical protein
LVLERVTENCLNPDITRKHLKAIAAAAERNKGLGFTSRLGKLGEPEEVLDDQGRPRKRYLVRLRVSEGKARMPEIAEERFAHVLDVLKKAAGAKEPGEWKVVSVKKGDKAQMPQEKKGSPTDGLFFGPRPPFLPPDLIDDVVRASMADIYEREAHIRILNDAVQTLVATNGEIRAHTILYGLPGGCKSTLLERLREVYNAGQRVERMSWIDAPTMTQAGFEGLLLEQADAGMLPEILVIEEGEKCERTSCFPWGP